MHVLEKIFYSTAKLGQQDRYHWLDSLCKLSEVCDGWRNTILSSKTLFASDHCGTMSSYGSTCQRILEAGLFCKVKKIQIMRSECLKMLVQVMNENSLSDIVLKSRPNGLSAQWSDEDLGLLTEFLSSCSKLTTINLHFDIDDQRMAEWFWRILKKVIHCNGQPKHLVVQITLRKSDSINWVFVENLDFYGKGSIQEVNFHYRNYSNPYNPDPKRPDWTYLSDAVSVNKVTIVDHWRGDAWRFFGTLKAKRIDVKFSDVKLFDITYSTIIFFNNFECLYIHLDWSHNLGPTLIEKINHTNAHVVGEFATMARHPLRVWAQALRNSSIKTFTFSAAGTTFDCDDSLLSNWIDHAKAS